MYLLDFSLFFIEDGSGASIFEKVGLVFVVSGIAAQGISLSAIKHQMVLNHVNEAIGQFNKNFIELGIPADYVASDETKLCPKGDSEENASRGLEYNEQEHGTESNDITHQMICTASHVLKTTTSIKHCLNSTLSDGFAWS